MLTRWMLVAAGTLLAASCLTVGHTPPGGQTTVPATAGSAPSDGAQKGEDGAWLELETLPVTKPADQAAVGAWQERCALVRRQSGHTLTHATSLGGDTPALLRATVWQSLQGAEAGSLALDGQEAALTAAGMDMSRRSIAHFRRVREQVNPSAANTPTGHLEVVVFRTKPGTTREQNLERYDRGFDDYASAEGLLAHSLWLGPDGRWVHLLHWRSEADFQKTGKALFGKPGVGGWIRSLDFKRFSMVRGDVLDPAPADRLPAPPPATPAPAPPEADR